MLYIHFGSDGTALNAIPNPAPKNGDKFGESISLSEKYLLIGNAKANHENATSTGAAYIYNGTTFLQISEILNPYPASDDSFGTSVFVSSDSNQFVVGSPDDQVDSVESGSAYLFSESDFIVPNNPPIAFAGNDKTVTQGNVVLLNGTGSYDPDGDSLSYFWNNTSGFAIPLNDTATISEKQFVAPDVTQPIQLIFELIVNDGTNSSAPDSITITVTNPKSQ